MAVFRYFAVDRGDLISGHSEGTEYSIEIPLSKWTPESKKAEKIQRSLSGRKFTTLLRIERYMNLATVPTDDPSVIEGLEEMFSSVAAGEAFYIDPFGTIASPGTEVEVSISGNHKVNPMNETENSYTAKVEKI